MDDDEEIIAEEIIVYRKGYMFYYVGNDAYSGNICDGNWRFCPGKELVNDTQDHALNAALDRWIAALPAAGRASLERLMV